MSSKPKVETVKTESTKGPLDATTPMFTDIWNRTGQAVASTNGQTFGGDFIAAPTTGQRDAVSQMYATAPTLGTAAGSLTDMAKKVASGFFLDPDNDPTFAAAAGAAINPVRKQLMETVLPGIVDKSIQAGGAGNGPAAYGGADQGIKQNQAIDAFNTAALDTTSKMANASRTAGMNLMPQAGAMAAAGNTEALMPSMVTGQAGTTEQQLNQQAINNLLAQWQDQQKAPFYGLQEGANILSTGGYSSGDALETKTGSAPSVATQWLQGLMGGASSVGSLFAAPAGGASAASGIGSALGSMGSWLGSLGASAAPLLMFSDRRLKERIRQVGTTFDGKPLYLFYYKANPSRPQIGLMSDEVDPAHVYAAGHGYDMVDYEAALAEAVRQGEELSHG